MMPSIWSVVFDCHSDLIFMFRQVGVRYRPVRLLTNILLLLKQNKPGERHSMTPRLLYLAKFTF